MKTGYRGTFVISWAQTEIDGRSNAPREALVNGAVWTWQGDATCVDGPTDVLRLGDPVNAVDMRQGAARRVRQLAGRAMGQGKSASDFAPPLLETGFMLTDGHNSFAATIIDVAPRVPPLLMFLDAIPPRGKDLWVARASLSWNRPAPAQDQTKGVICFTPGTRITTPHGLRLVEDLCAGDLISTRDNEAQPILWVGRRRITGARLMAYPNLRPVRFNPGALGIERPDQTLLVSPAHRMLIRSRAVSSLFNTTEVLVPAADLVNGSTIAIESCVREVQYIHLLLPQHNIVWANGVECESFHPANADMALLTEPDRARLGAVDDTWPDAPERYGAFARRNLTSAESAILLHDAG